MEADSVELRKDRFFYHASCAYCTSRDSLQLDAIAPFTWVDEAVWKLSDYDFKCLFISDVQVLCDPCLRRKKQIWKKAKKEGGAWLNGFPAAPPPIRKPSR